MSAASESKSSNPILEKFKQVEHSFNHHWLVLLLQIKNIVADEEEPESKHQFELLQNAYARWYEKLQADPKNMDACTRLYDAVKDNHELLMKRDTQLWTKDNHDFFEFLFGEPGINTPYLYDLLRDGLDPVDEEDEKIPLDQRDAKENLWASLISLYRLCILICVYLKMPMVREIIDLILVSNPDINQANIFEKILSEFKGKKRLRKLILRLLKAKEDSFQDIFSSLSKVIATFSTEVALDTNMKNNMNMAKNQLNMAFEKILKEVGVSDMEDVTRQRLITALEDKDETTISAVLDEGCITPIQLQQVRTLFSQRKLDKMNISKTMTDLGSTMSSLMSAIQSNNEEEVKNVLSQAGTGLNIDSDEMNAMQSELEQLESKIASGESKLDDDDEEEEDQEEAQL